MEGRGFGKQERLRVFSVDEREQKEGVKSSPFFLYRFPPPPHPTPPPPSPPHPTPPHTPTDHMNMCWGIGCHYELQSLTWNNSH